MQSVGFRPGGLPALTPIKTKTGEAWGEWRSHGSYTLLHGIVDGLEYRWLVDAAPIELEFGEIVWPPDVMPPRIEEGAEREEAGDSVGLSPGDAALFQRLTDLYGEPFHYGNKGQVIALNERCIGAALKECAFGGHLVYSPQEMRYFVYEEATGLWKSIGAATVKEQLSRMLRAMAAKAKAGGSLLRMVSAKQLSGVMNLLPGVVQPENADENFFGVKCGLIHCANGMVRANADGSAEHLEFSPEFRSRNSCGIAYDPEAKCPKFEALLEQGLTPGDGVFNEAAASAIQRYAGMALTGRNPCQKILLLLGNANTGKSTLVRTIQYLIGELNTTELRTRYLESRFEMFRFIGKSCLWGADVDEDFLSCKGASRLKALVGGDLLSCEGKGSNDVFNIHGEFPIILSSNCRLHVVLQGDTEAWRRRIVLVKFNGEAVPPEKRVEDYHKSLIEEEGSGILLWALRGLLELRRDMAEHRGFVMGPDLEEERDLLLRESDSVALFAEGCVTPEPGASLTMDELWSNYIVFCKEAEWTPQSEHSFRIEVKEAIVRAHRISFSNDIRRGARTQKGFRNLRIKEGHE